jgi:hypothetical protein
LDAVKFNFLEADFWPAWKNPLPRDARLRQLVETNCKRAFGEACLRVAGKHLMFRRTNQASSHLVLRQDMEMWQ